MFLISIHLKSESVSEHVPHLYTFILLTVCLNTFLISRLQKSEPVLKMCSANALLSCTHGCAHMHGNILVEDLTNSLGQACQSSKNTDVCQFVVVQQQHFQFGKSLTPYISGNTDK